MNKVVNVRADEVFKTLATGASVYSINTRTEELKNLKWEVTADIVEIVKNDEVAFYTVEKEEK